MPNIIRVGGCGGGLDLTVVGGLERPAEPKNNTLWLKTETEIGNVYLSPVMPANESATKNLLAGNYYKTTPVNITLTPNGGGTFRVTAGGGGYLFCVDETMKYTILLPAGTYTLSGTPVAGGGYTARMVLYGNEPGTTEVNLENILAEVTGEDNEEGVTFTTEQDWYISLFLTNEKIGDITAGGTYTIFYPQLEKGDKRTEFVEPKIVGNVWINTSNRYQSDATAIASTTHLLEVKKDPFLRINVLQFKQWDGDEWVRCDGGIYANNAWTDMALYIYWYGAQNEAYPLGCSMGSSTNSFNLDSDLTFEDDHFVVVGSKSSVVCMFGIRPGYGINAEEFSTLGFCVQKTSGTFNDGLVIGFTSNVDGSTTGSEAAAFDAQLFEVALRSNLTEVSVPITATGMVRPIARFSNSNASSATAVHLSVFYWVLT